MTVKSEFSTAGHVTTVREERSKGQKARDKVNNIKLVETMQYQPKIERRTILRTKNMGSWLTAHGTTIIGTVLSGMTFRGLYFSTIASPAVKKREEAQFIRACKNCQLVDSCSHESHQILHQIDYNNPFDVAF